MRTLLFTGLLTLIATLATLATTGASPEAPTPTSQWIFFYSRNLLLDDSPAMEETIVRAYISRNNLECGVQQVKGSGVLPLLTCYMEDSNSGIGGVRGGDKIYFTVDGMRKAPLFQLPINISNGQRFEIIRLLSSTSGDCNGDRAVSASDITALAFEFFDGDDNNNPLATAGGSYAGNPGCDANADTHIGASDITCIAMIFFNGPNACTISVSTAASATPVLSISKQLSISPDSPVTVPISLQTNQSAIGSLLFSLDYDETWLTFDPVDNNQDGIPDAVVFNLPATFVTSVSFDPNDIDGELDIVLASFSSPPKVLNDGGLLAVTLNAGNPSIPTQAAIKFAQEPGASFGDTQGQDLSGLTVDGSVLITMPTDTVTQSTLYLPLITQNR